MSITRLDVLRSYRSILKAARVAFRGDTRMLLGSKTKAREMYLQNKDVAEPAELKQCVEVAQEAAHTIMHELMQVTYNAERGRYSTSFLRLARLLSTPRTSELRSDSPPRLASQSTFFRLPPPPRCSGQAGAAPRRRHRRERPSIRRQGRLLGHEQRGQERGLLQGEEHVRHAMKCW